MPVPNILEIKTMIEQKDHRTLSLWLLVVIVPAIACAINPNLGYGYPLSFEPIVLFIIFIFRAKFEIKFDNDVECKFQEFLKEHRETNELLTDIANKHFLSLQMRPKFSSKFIEIVQSHIKEYNEKVEKDNAREQQNQANYKISSQPY